MNGGMHHPPRTADLFLTRREMLCRCGMGLGGLALASLLGESGFLSRAGASEPQNPLAPRAPHFAPRARRVIHFFMNGGPSQVDTFDPKPALERWAGKPLPTGNLQ